MVSITAPNIRGIEKLFEIYKELPDSDAFITTIEDFYEFMRKESPERKLFMDTCCSCRFFQVDSVAISRYKLK